MMADECERKAGDLLKTLAKELNLEVGPKKGGKKEDFLEKSDDEDGGVSFEDRMKFADKVRKLTVEQMTELVKFIQQLVPKAIEDIDSDKL